MAEASITIKQKPSTKTELDHILHPLMKQWFYSTFKSYSLPQLHGVMEIHSRKNILVSAPTGATKTLTAFMSILNELVDSSAKGILEDKIYAVYVSPLKALNRDISVNLIEPLEEIEKLHGKPLNIRVGVRTGDTTTAEKSQQLKKPPHILITTPESLAILLSTIKFKDHLRDVQWCIVDEVHALAENKRGVHLSITLERLQDLSPGMTRIGLSATVSPIEEIARYLVGRQSCVIADISFLKEMDLKVLSPVDDLVNVTFDHLNKKIYELLDDLIQQHKTTLIFTNTRAATERVVFNLKSKFPRHYYVIDERPPYKTSCLIGAHHSSLSKDHRFRIEEKLRNGELKCAVSSTSLELGIDIGFIDLVILLNSPKSVARALQRIGRSGHQLHATTKGRFIVTDRDELVECSVLLKNAMEKKIDRIHIPRNSLDVLAQQIFGMALEREWQADDMYALLRKTYCYENLSRTDFSNILETLAGEHTSLEKRRVYGKIIYNKDTGYIRRRGPMSRVIYMTNIGTIPDQSGITVKIGNYSIGVIEEAFLERLHKGDIFVLGGETYQFLYARGMTATVRAATGRKPTVPSWFSEMLPLSFDLANSIQHFRFLMMEKLKKQDRRQMLEFLNSYLYVDEHAANAIYSYFKEQYDYLILPNEKELLIENFTDKDKRYIIFHTLYGRRVNDVLSRSLALAISRTQHKDVEIGISDNGFYLSGSGPINVKQALGLLKAKELYQVMEQAIEKTEILRRTFRHCAGRAMMILRRYKNYERSVGKQQLSSHFLYAALQELDPNFFVIKEARREVLEDRMDITNAQLVIQWLEQQKIKVTEKETSIPSPFGFNLVLQGYTDILRFDDRHEFLRRMHQMVLAKISLKKNVDKDSKDLMKQANRPLTYDDLFEKAEQERQKNMPENAVQLREQIGELYRVPKIAKMEILNLINGETTISPILRQGLEQHKDTIKKTWPKELREFVFERAKIK